jgi:signal transduction histidine kinase
MADRDHKLGPRRGHTISLSLKLLAAFVLVILVAISVVALLSRQSAVREFTRFLREDQEGHGEPPSALVAELATYYAHYGHWTGAEALLVAAYLPDGDARGLTVLLVDADGRLIATNWVNAYRLQLPVHQLDNAWPIQVAGQTVGYVLVPGWRPLPPAASQLGRLGPEGLATVERMQQAIVIAGLSAGAVALVIAGVLAWHLVNPLRRLTDAADAIARGDLSQRVRVAGNDEVGELASSFNHMAAELERSAQLRRNMTADVAHELRTPLSIVRGKLEGVLDGVYPATAEHLQPVLEATDLLTVLVDDLRTLAQAEAGNLALERRPVNIGDLLHDAIVNFEPQASDQDVALVLDLPPEPPEVLVDWHRVNQVLGNLLTNALRHTPAGGEITLSAAADSTEARVTVTDTGTGIPAEDLPFVFDRFWRGDRSRSRASGGSGLGLAIVRHLVELHGGTIGAASRPGEGSQFWFTLPRAQAARLIAHSPENLL